MSRGWKNLEEEAWESLGFCDFSVKGSEEEKKCRQNLEYLESYLNGYAQHVDRNLDITGHFVRSQIEMRNNVLETGVKGPACWKVANNLFELYSYMRALREAEFKNNELGYVVKAISLQNIEGHAWPL